MAKLREWAWRLWGTLRMTRPDRDLEEELQFHLEMEKDAAMRRGASPEEAARQARWRAGHVPEAIERFRDQRGLGWLEDFVSDCRYGVRLLRRSPMFTCAAVLSLALGIGANTAIFSLMDAVMLRLMPVREPERLVEFVNQRPHYGRGSLSYPVFVQLQSELRSLEGLFAESNLGRREILFGGQAEMVNVELVSGSYYAVLGVNAVMGRTFTVEVDREAGAHPVAVISHGFWKRRFGLDPEVIGKTFQLHRTVFTIIGVTPSEFFGTAVGRAPEITIPATMDGEARDGPSWVRNADVNWLLVMGRLRHGYNLEQAQVEAATVFSRLVEAQAKGVERALLRKEILGQRLDLQPAGNGFDELRHRFSEPLMILMGIVALVLLIACANLANLLLARSVARRREMAVRLAIGAGRGRVVRQLLTEGLLLATLGGTLGVLLAIWSSNALVVMMSNGGPRMALAIQPDPRVLGFAAAVSVLACLLSSLAPAFLSARQTLQPGLAEARGSGRWRLGKGLIAAQVAISLLLLIGAGLFGRTLRNLYSVDAGFDRQGVVLFSINAGKAGYQGPRLRELQAQVVQELKTLPGVTSASLVLLPPISGAGGWDGSLFVEGYAHAPNEDDRAHLNEAGPGLFKTLGTRLLAGREFDERDVAGAPKVAVVNETFARYYFPGRSALGKWLAPGKSDRDHVEIVGVVQDVKYQSLRQDFPRTVFFPVMQRHGPDWHLFVLRTTTSPGEMGRAIEAALGRLNQALRPSEVRSLEEHVSRSILQERMLAMLAGVFGLLALVVASVGIYGVMAFQVARRQKEIGIRMALGGRPREVVRMVVGETARLALLGGGIGMAAALVLTRVLEKMLFGVRPDDPLTFVLAGAALGALVIGAAYPPARRAARLNPVDALRCE
jgi:predicted permease